MIVLYFYVGTYTNACIVLRIEFIFQRIYIDIDGTILYYCDVVQFWKPPHYWAFSKCGKVELKLN